MELVIPQTTSKELERHIKYCHRRQTPYGVLEMDCEVKYYRWVPW